jgi:acyl-CoA dehydrogenase
MTSPSAERQLLRATVSQIFAEHCTAQGAALGAAAGWDAGLWRLLETGGLTAVGIPERSGGSGGELADAAVVLTEAGRFAAAVPLAETLGCGLLLARLGIAMPPGPLTLALGHSLVIEPRDGGYAVRGTLFRVPYGRVAGPVVAVCGDGSCLLLPPGSVLRPGANLAAEPRDDIQVDIVVSGDVVRHAAGGFGIASTLMRLTRTLLLAGAAERALELTVAYVTEREQFGKALARQQAVQQQLARMAGEVALVRSAASAAVRACADQLDDLPAAWFAVTVAKAEASRAAGVIAAIAHQLHGAIGTTNEHRLRLTTTRLWSWRDEDGSESQLFAELGRYACAVAPGRLWPLLTGTR